MIGLLDPRRATGSTRLDLMLALPNDGCLTPGRLTRLARGSHRIISGAKPLGGRTPISALTRLLGPVAHFGPTPPSHTATRGVVRGWGRVQCREWPGACKRA